jgi:hypothetical protein
MVTAVVGEFYAHLGPGLLDGVLVHTQDLLHIVLGCNVVVSILLGHLLLF